MTPKPTNRQLHADMHADQHATLTELTQSLVGFETLNPPGHTRAIIDMIKTYLRELGIETDRYANDSAKPNLIATLPGASEWTLCYNGHVDTVPFDASEWRYDPLGEQDGDRVYGRETTDMKGAVAAMLTTARTYVETDTTPPVTLRFAFVSDEETGGDAGLEALIAADRIEADACIIGETTCEQGRHSVTVADRGSIWLTLEATGNAAHGSRPVLGENAIDRLLAAISDLLTLLDTRKLNPDTTIDPILDESVEYYASTMGAAAARDLFAEPTVNLGTIEGGQAINSVPTRASAEIDIRLTASVHTPDVLSNIRKYVDSCEGVDIDDVSWSIGSYEPIDSPLVDAVASVATEVTGERVYRRSATGGGDAKTLRQAGIPTVEFGLGTETAHAVDEYTTTDALVENAAIYTQVPYVIAEQGEQRDVTFTR